MSNELTDRRQMALEHIRRFRISSAQVLQERFCGGSENVLKKLLAGLREFVASETLFGKYVYYRLTPAGARLMGAPEEIGRPLGAQALPKAFGIFAFCCLGPVSRWRYTRPEFAEDFPELTEELMGDDYYLDFYLDHDGQTVRFGHLIVDLGSDYQKLLQKCRGRVRRGLRTPVLSEIIANDLFAIAVVVPNEEKRRAIEEALKRQPLRAWIRIEVVAQLGQLLAG